MTALFTAILEMSIKSIPVILVLFVLRVLLRCSPRKYSYALWAVAAFRLLCPVSVSSAFSLFNLQLRGHGAVLTIPIADQSSPAASAQPDASALVPAVPVESAADQNITLTVNPPTVAVQSINWDLVLSVVWLVGVVAVLAVTLFQLWRLLRRTRFAVRVEDNVWESDNIPGPFVFGLLRPRIYLPVGLQGVSRAHVLAHERYHLRRKDHWVKLLGQFILALHWFNPAVWLMLWAVDRDMELSCDEGAIRAMSGEERQDYSRTLLALAASRREFGPVLAFGAPAVKQRIVNVLHYHKAAKLTVVLALAVLLVAGLTCCTDAKTPAGASSSETYAEALYNARVEYVGDNSGVVSLIQRLTVDTQCQLHSIELHTGEEPYGITLELNVPETSDQTTYQAEMVGISTLLLTLVDNLSWCEVYVVDPAMDGYLLNLDCFSVSLAEEWLGIDDLKSYADTPEAIAQLMERLNEQTMEFIESRSDPIPEIPVEDGSRYSKQAE